MYTCLPVLCHAVEVKVTFFPYSLDNSHFIEEQKDITLVFRGSANQRIIDVRKTLEQDDLVLYQV